MDMISFRLIARIFSTIILIFLVAFVYAKPGFKLPQVPDYLPEVKRQLTIIHSDNPQSRYCGCRFDPTSLHAKGTCNQGSRITSWFRIIPLKQLLVDRACWKNAAKICGSDNRLECCLQKDKIAKTIANDLQNWAPIDQKLLSKIQGKTLGPIAKAANKKSDRLACGVRISKAKKRFTPPDRLKGDSARLFYYFRDHYGIVIKPEMEPVLRQWHMQDPPDDKEAQRNRWVKLMQKAGLAISVTTIQTYTKQLKATVGGQGDSNAYKKTQKNIIAEINKSKRNYRSIKSAVNHYIKTGLGLHAYQILNGKKSNWQPIFDALEMHYLATEKSQFKISDLKLFAKMMSLARSEEHTSELQSH